MTLPHFFVAGPPKAGTTALHAALAPHPQLFLSKVKEPKFYLCDGPPPSEGGPGDAHSYREWIWRREDYEALFADAPHGALRGESTPFYLSDFDAQRRIQADIPDAKFIAILRDPIDRAYSNWTHLWSDGLEPEADFLTACEDEERRVAEGWAPFWRYRGLGKYGEQLEHLHTLFPPEQVHLLRYKDLVDQPIETLDGICRFLGVDERILTEVPAANVSTFVEPTLKVRTLQTAIRGGAAVGRLFPPQVWRTVSAPLLRAMQGDRRNRPELSVEDRATLIEYFTPDVRLLESLTGRSFEDWLGHREGGTYSVRKSWAPSSRLAS